MKGVTIGSRRPVAVLGALVLVDLLTSAGASWGAGTPEQKCQGGKNAAAGKHAACVTKAEKGFVLSADAAKYAESVAKCDAKYASIWGKLEGKALIAGTTCPSMGDEGAIRDFVDACTQSVAVAVSGGTLPSDVITCNADLVTCQGDLATCEANAGLPKTGQTTGYGPGSDGDLEAGVASNFTDNGDGTITDALTGLMWEKKSNDGSIHDVNNLYTWGMTTAPYTMNGTMVTAFLANLNSGGGFAGYTDWRIPNQFELESLRNIGTSFPATHPAFRTSCPSGCTVLTCSCTGSDRHWSSSTDVNSLGTSAWYVNFIGASVDRGVKSDSYRVRAVRGGL